MKNQRNVYFKVLIFLPIFLFLGVNLFSQKSVEKNIEDGKKNEPINVIIVSDELFKPFISKIKSPFVKDYSFTKIKPHRKPQKVEISSYMLNLYFENSHLNEKSGKIYSNIDFPFKSYFLLYDKISTGGVIKSDPRCNSQNKIKVAVIFKTGSNLVPEKDVESYAKIYIDKKFKGTTDQKLLSQMKSFEFETSCDKHILKIVVYKQDLSRKRWRRLRNIDQPPSKYFVPDVESINRTDKKILYLIVTFYPEKRIEKYKFEGPFITK